ncbi:MAG: hypothetical protein K2N47_02070 [Clostridia bacterium]|nr:hypothetical protein [Clostridia bacterium]
MPDYFSHAICAQRILELCDKNVKKDVTDRTLYMLGAQGGDVFFAYKLSFLSTNLGRKMHAMDARTVFENLQGESKSYIAGFATHYALDCTLHPLIYGFAATQKSPLAHMAFEKDLGLYISRKFAIPRNILPCERILARTFTLYDCIVKLEPRVTVTGIERCLKRHFAYTRAILKSKKQTYKFDYDFSSLSGAVDDAVSFGADCVKAAISGNVSSQLFSRSFLER